MNKQDLLTNPNYDPNGFLDWLLVELNCRNDAALSRKLETARPILSKLRHKRLPVGDSILVRVSDQTGMGTLAIKQRMFREQSA